MSTSYIAGVIAEYNPFHQGHLYHLRTIMEQTKPQALIVVLSSSFVQRGLPAFADKKTRVLAALRGGADLILEMPVVFSSHNAGVFANAGVDILAATRVVTHLSFGMETPSDMNRILDILIHEPVSFKNRLQSELARGYSFVEARCRTLESLIPGSETLLRYPNNSLALAYALRVRQKGYPLKALPIARIGAAYHDTSRQEVSSATAIRKEIQAGNIEGALALLPPFSSELIREAWNQGSLFLRSDHLWRILQALLLRASSEDIKNSAEMREGLENLLKKTAAISENFEDFIDRCVSRRYPRGRIQRHCAHFLLGLDHASNRKFQKQGVPYIRVLGANAVGRTLVRRIKLAANLPIISRAVAPHSPYSQQMMHFEHLATQIRNLCVPQNYLKGEKDFVPIMIP